ncbi:hypothetical protein Goklo_012148 [Gossypium klotzschianum]|uniref:Uncharacterized protein n=1 Tax=Gossypium klotzschianum TaxID=34286 RepID=A0A7J8VCE1_9ROSI|nr:hypothetical protein [Gossypium klotzschianum]
MELLVRCDWGLRLYPKAFLIKKVWFEVHESIINLKDFDLLLQERLSAEAERMRYVSLHDVVLDMARWIASKENSGLKILFLDNYDSKTPIARLDLKVLYIRRASGSSNLFSLNVLSSLRDLRVLQVEEFIEVMAISTLTKLKGVEFLVCVVNVQVAMILQNLRSVLIEDCKSLKRIEIRGCLQLAQVFNGDNGVVHRISQSGLRVVDYPRLRIKRSEFN